MTDLLIIQKSSFPSFGIMSISAYLKKAGFSCDLILASEEKDLKKAVQKKRPLFLGFPVITGEHSWVLKTALALKTKKIKIILGGPHATYYPEIIKEKVVDMVIRGEAEETLVELLKAYKKGKNYKKIKNLWIKENGKIYRNDLRPLIANLDNLPLFDRQIYYQYNFLKKASVKQFLTSRGCPYLCTFCSNNLLRNIYDQKGRYLRRISPQRVILEMRQVKEKYGMRTLSFTDDNFVADPRWLAEFLPLYRKKIGLPFMCNVTANLVTEKLIKDLKKAGCYGVSMGIETGNEKLRIEVLKKYITNKQILKAGRIIKKYGLILKTYNILCLPGETLENAFETVLINAKIKPDHTSCSLLQPYPNYEITEYAIQNGFLKKDFSVDDVFESIYEDSPIHIPDKDKIKNLQTFFFIATKFPKLIPLIKLLIKLPPNRMYKILAEIFYGLYMSKVHRLTLVDIVRYALHIDAFKV